MSKNHKEVIHFGKMDNSEQKNSIEDDDTKYVKTPELNMGEKYSHKCSDNKLSERSTEKESKKTNRCHSSQKKKSIKVAQEILECKKDLMKMQKINAIRKRKIIEDTDQDKDLERRKQNLEMLNDMLKKRNQHFKKKKRNQEKLLKKDLINFEKSIGVSFNKKCKKRKLQFKNMKRNQTFSCLSNKAPCDTLNTSKNEIYTDEKKKPLKLEFKISIKKDKIEKPDNSASMIYSPGSKPAFSSQKKHNGGVSNTKRHSAKKMNDSLATNSSSKLRSSTKLAVKSLNTSQIPNPKRGYTNISKTKKKGIRSESKKNSIIGPNHFNDISEIQEFNMTDEESMINTSILKNIEDHESLNHPEGVLRESSKRVKTTPSGPKKIMQSTLKKPKKGGKKPKKMKFISSAKKSSKKPKKTIGEGKDTDKKSTNKKRKVVFHITKPVEILNLESEPVLETEEEDIPEYNKQGQIKKVEFYDQDRSCLEEDTENEIVDMRENKFSRGQRSSQQSNEPREVEKIEMADSERLSELLSSKKKHRYNKPPQDSMDGIMEEGIEQHINFTDEEQNMRGGEYTENDESKVSYRNESFDQDIDNLVAERHDQSSYSEAEGEHDLYESEISDRSTETVNQQQISQQDDQEEEPDEQAIMIQSMPYQQEQQEQNDVIEESCDENQTVINCTQSDEVISQSNDERISDRNVVVEEFSLEYEEQKIVTQSTVGIAQVSISKDERYPQQEMQVYSYHDDESQSSEEQEEEASNIEYQLEQNPGQEYYSPSEDDYSNDLINEMEEEDYHEEQPSHNNKKYFESTLTNIRLAFGSEQQVRENSVKTFEKFEHSAEASSSGKKPDEKSSIFEKKSFQDFSLKKFTELMQVKNMKNFQTSIQKTFREYNESKLFSTSDKKEELKRTSSTPKKSKYVSPRKFSMRDLELDRIGYEKMKENSEKKNQFIQQIIGSASSSSQRHNHTSVLYKTNLSIDKCKKEISMQELSEDKGHSVGKIEYKILSPKKNRTFDNKPQDYEELSEQIIQPTFESPEPSKSEDSHPSCKKLNLDQTESIEKEYLNETPYEDDNIETVKLDSSRLRSQKRGLPIDEVSCDKEETPKCYTTQRRILHTEENCYTGEKYILGDCFTDEKMQEMKIRNALTSAKKINPLQILRDLKSPASSSYISSAKKALMQDQDFTENDRIHFQLSAERCLPPLPPHNDKENAKDTYNIQVSKLDSSDPDKNALKDFVNANKFQVMEQDYNLLESPEKSHQKHSKSRSRTKEKRGNRSDGELETYELLPAEGFAHLEDNTCMAIDFSESPDQKHCESGELEETSQSLEWFLSKNIDKKKRDEICRNLAEDQSRNTSHSDRLNCGSNERETCEIEVEEVKRVRFGNSMIRNENVGESHAESDSNLGHYIE